MNRIKIVATLHDGKTREIGSWPLPLHTKEDQDDVIYYIRSELDDPKVSRIEIITYSA